MTAYIHQTDKEGLLGTLAINLPTKVTLTTMFLQHASHVMVELGVAKLSPKDKFNKKIGREVSLNKIVPVKAELIEVTQVGVKHVYHFHVDRIEHKENPGVVFEAWFHVTTLLESPNVKLIKGRIYEYNKKLDDSGAK